MDTVIHQLEAGLPAGAWQLKALDVRPGRFVEETLVTVGLTDDREHVPVAMVLLYRGRPPYYRPWVEVFGQTAEVRMGEKSFPFFDSPVEWALLRLVAGALGPGGRIFVDCEADLESLQGMRLGIPSVLTRVGFLLYRLGFTWFKPWYISEGMREGGQKMQAEKAVDEVARARHMRTIRAEVEAFMAQTTGQSLRPEVRRALQRAQEMRG